MEFFKKYFFQEKGKKPTELIIKKCCFLFFALLKYRMTYDFNIN